MKNKTNVFVKLIKSIYNVKEFPKYMLEGVGRAVVYILILCLIIGTAKGIATSVGLNSLVKETVATLEDDKYQFKVKDNVLDVEISPVMVEEDNTLVYIDKDITIAKSTNLKSITVNSDVYVLILKDGIIFSSNSKEQKIHYNEMGFKGEFNNQSIIEIINNFKMPIILIIMLISIVGAFIIYLLTTLFISLIALIINNMLNLNLKYGVLFSLVAYIGTLPTILVAILVKLIPTGPFFTVGVVGTIVYTGIVLNNIKKNMKKEMYENINIE